MIKEESRVWAAVLRSWQVPVGPDSLSPVVVLASFQTVRRHFRSLRCWCAFFGCSRIHWDLPKLGTCGR